MRVVDKGKIEKRKNKVLQAAVHHYIKTGSPTSSKILVSDYAIKYSSATVRNILSELETDGYLMQTHTSSGRIPTDRGYRAYVDMLNNIQNITLGEIEKLKVEYDKKITEMEDVLINTTKILSSLSHYSGFASLPPNEKTVIKSIELLHLDEEKCLFVFITNTGLVKHKLLHLRISKKNLRYIVEFLREKLKGLTVTEAQQNLDAILDDFNLEVLGMTNLDSFIRDSFSNQDDFYIDGLPNIIALPEFRDYNITDSLVSAKLEKSLGRSLEKSLITTIAQNLSDAYASVKVIIGSETRCKGFECISAVASSYKKDNRPIGVLGIIGPKRMEYKRMMHIVTKVSRMLDDILKNI